MSTWYIATEDDAEATLRLVAAWPAAPIENVELCGFILDTARLQIISYAPTATDPAAALAALLLQVGLSDRLEEVLAVLALEAEAVPFNYVLAQLQQAKNLWAAGRADENGDIGTEGYSFVPRPLDKTIRNIIRPVQGTLNAL